MRELEKIHPNIREIVTDIELKLWGHAMIRPTNGAIWTNRLERKKIMESFSNIVFAHSDHSGISIFEEAFHQGWKAAQQVITKHTSA